MFDTFDKNYKLLIATLSYCSEVITALDLKEVPAGCAVSTVGADCDIYLQLEGQIDIPGEVQKMDKRADELQTSLDSLTKQSQSKGYEKVPEEVKKENANRMTALQMEILNIKKAIIALEKIKNK